MRSRKGMLAASLCVAALGVAACGDDENEETSGSAPAAQAPAGDGTVSFISPSEGATTSGTVTAEVDLKDFAIDPKGVGMANQAGRGHLHFSLDEGKFDYPKYSGANGKLAVSLGVDGKYSPSVMPKITYRNLPKGEHTLEVYLANNDHSNAGATASTTFTVE